MNQTTIDKIGWLASFLAIAMYFSYIDQIKLNLSGHPGSIILPIVTTFNCTAWTVYGFFKTPKMWPIVVCNAPGIVLAIITVITAIIR